MRMDVEVESCACDRRRLAGGCNLVSQPPCLPY